MEQNYYLRIENNCFGFLLLGLHEIRDTDIEITNEDYNEYFYLQFKGKQFRLKSEPTGAGLFDYIEEYIPENIQVPIPSETDILKEKVNALEKENANLLKDSILKGIRLESIENDMADLMKEIVLGGI